MECLVSFTLQIKISCLHIKYISQIKSAVKPLISRDHWDQTEVSACKRLVEVVVWWLLLLLLFFWGESPG